MVLIAKNNIKHNGEFFVSGDQLPEMEKKEAKRLVSLGVAEFVNELPAGLNEESEAGSEETNSESQTESSTEEDDLPEDYNEWDYTDLKEEVKKRELITENKQGPTLIAALKADDEEFQNLEKEAEEKGIKVTVGLTTIELKELLEGNE